MLLRVDMTLMSPWGDVRVISTLRGHRALSSARRNVLGIGKSSWSRIREELRYHPYKVVKRQKLKHQDPFIRLIFCECLVTLYDKELLNFL